VEYGDEPQLSRSLIELLSNPDETRRLGAAAFNQLRDRFTYDRFLERLSFLLEQSS